MVSAKIYSSNAPNNQLLITTTKQPIKQQQNKVLKNNTAKPKQKILFKVSLKL